MACPCRQLKIFTIKHNDGCICTPTEEKLTKILECSEVNRDRNIDIRFQPVDTHLIVGAPIDIDAKQTIVFNLFNLPASFSELNTPGDLFVSIVDVLHHVEFPENLVEMIIERLKSPSEFNKNNHCILISDHDVQSWEDAYYIDEVHYAQSIISDKKVLPTFGYRSRSYWREYMAKKGYRIVAEPPSKGLEYIDIYTK